MSPSKRAAARGRLPRTSSRAAVDHQRNVNRLWRQEQERQAQQARDTAVVALAFLAARPTPLTTPPEPQEEGHGPATHP